jgi:hypothetical protein
MAKWEENEYVAEELQKIKANEIDERLSEELFNEYSEAVKEIHPTIYSWLVDGYTQSQYWNQHSTAMSKEWLAGSKRAYENRVAGAKKAAETKRLNKAKVA